jgi:hypothetical protein
VSRPLQAVNKVNNTELPPVDCEVGPEKSLLLRTTFIISAHRHRSVDIKGLADKENTATGAGEVLKLIELPFLATRFEFANKYNLWSTTGTNRLLNGPNFRAKMGIFRTRFDELWSHLTFRYQADHLENKYYVQKRWKLVTDFVDSTKDHRQAQLISSAVVCIDE